VDSRRAISLAVCVLAASILLAGAPVVAAGNTVTGTVAPRSGTTATKFAFTARYIGVNGASTVIARLAGNPLTITLTRTFGNNKAGTWTGARSLPLGSWLVQFEARSQNNRLLSRSSFGPVTVVAQPKPAPTATPKPAPTPRPTTRPTTKATASPAASVTPTASGTGGPSESPPSTPTAIGGATEPSASPFVLAAGGSSPKDQSGSLLLATLLGVLVVAGVGGIALLAGRRRAEEEPASPVPAPEATSPSPVVADEAAAAFAARVNPPPSTPEPAPRPASWEAYADINDRPIGTVDELPPGDYQRRPHDGSG
jgi:hypothetical protein